MHRLVERWSRRGPCSARLWVDECCKPAFPHLPEALTVHVCTLELEREEVRHGDRGIHHKRQRFKGGGGDRQMKTKRKWTWACSTPRMSLLRPRGLQHKEDRHRCCLQDRGGGEHMLLPAPVRQPTTPRNRVCKEKRGSVCFLTTVQFVHTELPLITIVRSHTFKIEELLVKRCLRQLARVYSPNSLRGTEQAFPVLYSPF